MKGDEMKQQVAAPIHEIRAGAYSAKGLREENQDAMTRFQSRFGEVILVADGMGGHQGGAVASDMVAKRFRRHLDAAAQTAASVAEALQQASERVNDEVYERGHSGDAAIAGMGSTLVIAVLTRTPAGQEVVVANAGDSRAYLVRDGVLRQLTKDHTAAQRMVDAGMLSEADARSHPEASVLSRALGQQLGTAVETYPPVSLQPGDGLLLCSDGLSGYATDPDIAAIIAGAADPNSAVRALVDLALKKGSDDNITVQFLRLGANGNGAPTPAAIPAPRKTRYVIILAAILAIILAGSAAWFTYRMLHPPKPTGVKVQGAGQGQGPVDGAKKEPAQQPKPGPVTQPESGHDAGGPAPKPKPAGKMKQGEAGASHRSTSQ